MYFGPWPLCWCSLCSCVLWAAPSLGRTSSVLWCKLASRGTNTRAALGPWLRQLHGSVCSAGISQRSPRRGLLLDPDGEGHGRRG